MYLLQKNSPQKPTNTHLIYQITSLRLPRADDNCKLLGLFGCTDAPLLRLGDVGVINRRLLLCFTTLICLISLANKIQRTQTYT
jgi:hypothetical protein